MGRYVGKLSHPTPRRKVSNKWLGFPLPHPLTMVFNGVTQMEGSGTISCMNRRNIWS